MSLSDRSKFSANPCSPAEIANNWRILHRLLSRFPWEPTEEDDGKIPYWNNGQIRFLLKTPCQAVSGCGGSGGECATPGTHASGITPDTKTLTLGGTIDAENQAILDGSPYTLICDGADRYTYLDVDYPGGILSLTLNCLATSAIVENSVGSLTGSGVWTLAGLVDPYDYEADLDDAYPFTQDTSSNVDWSNVTVTISA